MDQLVAMSIADVISSEAVKKKAVAKNHCFLATAFFLEVSKAYLLSELHIS